MYLKFKNIKKYILYILIIFFCTLGITFFLLLTSFNLIGDQAKVRFMLALSQKLRIESYLLLEIYYNKKYNKTKNFGEFCYNFMGSEINDKKIKLSQDEQKIRGAVYTGGNFYSANINTTTLELELSSTPTTWNWRWYNWFAIGIDKIH